MVKHATCYLARPHLQDWSGEAYMSSNNITIDLHLHAAVGHIRDALEMVPPGSNASMKLQMARQLIEAVVNPATSDT